MLTSAKLKVDEARRSDVGRQIARIPAAVADNLGLRTGDIIEINGRRTTYAKVWRSAPPTINSDTIRIESITRRNAKVNLDDFVEIRSAQVKLATNVLFQPIQQLSIAINLAPYLTRALIDRVVTAGDIVAINTGFGGVLYLLVVTAEPQGAVLLGENTKLALVDKETQDDGVPSTQIVDDQVHKISYEDIGGLEEPIKKIREMIELPLRHPEVFERLGIQPPKGVLLFGPPGTGKTLLAKAIASETSSHFISIGGPEIMSKYYGESENRLRDIFEEAKGKPSSIIFIDEIDSIAPKREDTHGEVERRIVAQLLSLMDGLEDRGNVVVIAATNRPDSIDPALRRGGRFDREIEIGIPDIASRKEILSIHIRGMPLDDDVDRDELAARTHGFVGADLETLAKEAALSSLRKFLPNFDLSESDKLDLETLSKLNIKMTDFEQALIEVSPSALREVFIEVPNITWDMIGGLSNVKEILTEAIEWPLKYQPVFTVLRAKPPAGVLLYGPPGTGKTMLAKAVANESNANFISIKGPELISKWVGESEKGVREIFRKARNAAPCVIFFDEIDSIASTRTSTGSDSNATRRVVSQLLTEIDGLEEMKGVTILAATNRPDMIDPALLRPGRFDKVILVGNPDQESRKAIFDVHLTGMNISSHIDINELAEQTDGLSGAEIAQIIQNARMVAIREFVTKSKDSEDVTDDTILKNLMLTSAHIDEAFELSKPSRKQPYDHRPPGISELSDIDVI
ncbi:MAG: CDC48 family AAA ATPase [Candidatus Kariarchaeaceae archaeon]|jgi:transitional endoplasmic reticulum ATPase